MARKRLVWRLEHVSKGTVDLAAQLPHADFSESERFEGRVLTNFEKKV